MTVRAALSGHRNGLPASRGYVRDPRIQAREVEVSAQLEAIRRQVREGMTAEPMTFTDPISEQRCELVLTPEVGVKHPGCNTLADLVAHLDAFYCPQCGMNGRISGAWAMRMMRNG
jgi:hypothetical protein